MKKEISFIIIWSLLAGFSGIEGFHQLSSENYIYSLSMFIVGIVAIYFIYDNLNAMNMKAEEIIKYMKHLPTCYKMQDWSEADQALADTQQKFRDADYQAAIEELQKKKNICSCGLDEVIKKLKDEDK